MESFTVRKLRKSAHAVHGVLLRELANITDGEKAYALAQWLASFLLGNPCGIYFSDELEERLLPTQPQALHVLRSGIVSRAGILHLLSEPYQHGGHTRVARHLMEYAPGVHNVLLTRRVRAPDAHVWLGVDSSCVRYLPGPSTCCDHVTELAVEIASYSEVILYLHPDDIVGGVAVRLARRLNPDLRVGFFNHADHAFSVGVGSADCVFEISTYGWQLRRARGIEDRATFVGIPIAVSHASGDIELVNAGSPKVFLAGTAYKFRPVGDQTLLEALEMLLATSPDLTLDLAGSTGREPWWRKLRARFKSRIRFHGLISHDCYKTLLKSSALYIDSYPKTGGTAFPEALLSGAKVVGLFGGTWGFSLADTLRTSGVDAFVARCKAILRKDARVLRQLEQARQDCAVFHDPSAVWMRIAEGLREGVLHSPPRVLAEMPAPPILAENEWTAAGRITMRLPDRDSSHAKWVHRVLWRAHVEVFGLWHPGSLRWAVTWMVRYALRSQ